MIFLLLGLGLSLWASYNINSTFRKYSQLFYSKHAAAEVVANWILKQYGITKEPLNKPREYRDGLKSWQNNPRRRQILPQIAGFITE